MQFYGIKNKENKSFKSYLTGRTQFTQIEQKKSKIRKSLNCSVVQGGKLSSILYLILTDDIPRLHKLMKNQAWMQENLKE